jgi:alkylmercury lyase
MNPQINLETIARQLAAQLDCMQDVVCRQILHTIADSGQPVAPTRLATILQLSQEELHLHLAHVPDTEFDRYGNIVGWGVTLVSTAHHFQIGGKPLYTWCAFDTVLFPALLQVEAQVQSVCAATGSPITFVATAEGIQELSPATSVLSLIVPIERCDCVRGTFCQQSLFFQSEQVAATFLALHPEALVFSIEEAACVGHTMVSM